MLSKLFAALAILILPPAAFYAGYLLTDAYFRRQLVPAPFEACGIAAGAGCFFLTLSLLVLLLEKKKKG